MTEVTYFSTYRSPIGLLVLFSDGDYLTRIRFTDAEGVEIPPEAVPSEAPFKAVVGALDAYFAGELTQFAIPIAPRGTPFQHRVWAELQRIPFGETISYSALAARVGDVLAVRAVAAANGKNPIPILIPCHRVIGAGGDLTGYAGGLPRKKRLLELEAACVSAGPLFNGA